MENLVGKILLNRYRVDSFLGRGGMAEVYKVWDEQRAAYLAMKLLYEDLAIDRVFMRRFQREAQTLERLQHPNIVRFYGMEQEGHLAFLLLDFVAGETLKHRIFDAQGSLPLAEIRAIMRSIYGALQFAHGEGLVHCDIKPGNIMINQHGQALLADFGIARLTDAATATMVGVGTPAYMAPEQARGLDPVPQTDIYGMGIVLFEMLTGGERPFTGEQASITGSTSEKVRWEQVHLPPISPIRFNPHISPELEAVVLKCLEKDPANRYASALDLINAFEGAVARGGLIPTGAPIPPSPPVPPIVDDDEGTTMQESKPFAPIPALPTSQSQPAAGSKKWVWLVVIGVTLIFMAYFLMGLLKDVFLTPTSSPIRTSAVAVAPATEVPDTEVAEEPSSNIAAEPQSEPPTYTPLPTYTALPTYTPMQPTETPRLEPTDIPPTETDVPANTPVPEKAYVVADQNYFCRQRPDPGSEEHWMFMNGSKNYVLGKMDNWWLIAVDDSSTRTECCWVSGGNPGGDTSIIPDIYYEIDRMNCPVSP